MYVLDAWGYHPGHVKWIASKGRGVAAPAFLSPPYSPSYLEVEFSEVHIQNPAYTRPDWSLGAVIRAFTPHERSLHLVVLDKDTGERIGSRGEDGRTPTPRNGLYWAFPPPIGQVISVYSGLAYPHSPGPIMGYWTGSMLRPGRYLLRKCRDDSCGPTPAERGLESLESVMDVLRRPASKIAHGGRLC